MCERPNEERYERINEQAHVQRANELLYSALLIHVCAHTCIIRATSLLCLVIRPSSEQL